MSAPPLSSQRRQRRGAWSALLCTLALALLLAGFAAAPDVVRLMPASPEPREHPPAARFSHLEHGSFGCYECHPGLFSTPRARITHGDMKRGLACGACHDGAFARSVKELGCQSCHRP